jgi:choline dehydrogenase-like flavoprotein
MFFVIGSGPAGVSCAKALLAQGVKVTMLDVGLNLEPEREAQIVALQATPLSEWAGEASGFLREGMESGSSGIPVKLTYGSDYPYRSAPGTTAVEFENAKAGPSHATGGLSTVWGSAVLPYRQQDMVRWPISVEDLVPGYEAIFRWMPLSAHRDGLEPEFPFPRPLPMSRQASRLLTGLGKSKARLNSKGVFFGASRIAVEADGHAGSHDCVLCGLCMYGCPYRLIYATDRTVNQMRADPNFIYIPGVTVRGVEEDSGSVTIHAVDRTRNQVTYSGERVYLATGPYVTTSILLRSMGRFDSTVKFCDSQYFLLPILRAAGAGKVTDEKLHTLAQLFMEITDNRISPYTIHLQTYTYNDLFKAPVEAALGPLRHIFPMNQFLGRLLLFQGYLHSEHSAHMEAKLVKQGSDDVLKVTGISNPETRATMRKLLWKLISLSGATGSIPLIPVLQMGEPGRGYHTGGSFPMHAHPGQGQSDIYGRPTGYSRVHAVDSTVFPSIAATTITLTSMANAYRIGSQLNRYA